MTIEQCPHVDQVRPVGDAATVCEDCVPIGGRWLHLRQCRSCGRTSCCSDSPNTHSIRHFEATGHPIMRAIPAGSWSWCYACGVTLREVDGQLRPVEE